MDTDQTAPIGAVCSGSMLFASIHNSSVMLGNYLQQTTLADNIFRCFFFLGPLRVNAAESVAVHPCKVYSVNFLLEKKAYFNKVFFKYGIWEFLIHDLSHKI